MKSNENKNMESYTALIASLENENKIQSRLIEAQRTMIEALEAHNAELEKIISDISSI
jgi:bacterioferritin (cytochrome b1)